MFSATHSFNDIFITNLKSSQFIWLIRCLKCISFFSVKLGFLSESKETSFYLSIDHHCLVMGCLLSQEQNICHYQRAFSFQHDHARRRKFPTRNTNRPFSMLAMKELSDRLKDWPSGRPVIRTSGTDREKLWREWRPGKLMCQ